MLAGRRVLRFFLMAGIQGLAFSFAPVISGTEAQVGENFRLRNTVRLGPILGYGSPGPVAEAPPNISAKEAGGDIIWGADIGLPVTIPLSLDGTSTAEATYFFFGDTDLLDWIILDQDQFVQPYQAADLEEYVDYGVLQGDGYAFSFDEDADDGIALSHLFRNRETGETAPVCEEVRDDGFRAMWVPGVHPSPCSTLELTGDDPGARLLTPTGAWALDEDTLLVVIADQTPYGGVPQASSYLAASTDYGLNWQVLNGGRPISSASSSGEWHSKFVHVDVLHVDAAEYQDDARSGPCPLPLPDGDDTGGILMYGAGLWTQSNVYLAFVADADLRAAVADPEAPVVFSYFAGESGDSCWSTEETEAVPVLHAKDNTAFQILEAPCGHRVIQDETGPGYVSVDRLRGTLSDGRKIDRLVMLSFPAYLVCTADSPEPCCGGTPIEGTEMCTGWTDDYKAYLVEGSPGIVMVTGDPWRPWLLNVGEGDPSGLPPVQERPFRPLTVPPDPKADWYGSGPYCQETMTWRDVIVGYSPLIVDRFTRISADGRGFDLYFLVSRWGAKLSPDDPGERDDGYHYEIDLFRTQVLPPPLQALKPPGAEAAQ